jgi:hypothetical protein
MLLVVVSRSSIDEVSESDANVKKLVSYHAVRNAIKSA